MKCLVLALTVAFASVAAAAPHKVLVLPIDGNADPGTRTQVNATIQKLARGIDGTVTVADTTFAETATAVGCDPGTTACADTVLAALGVDELVWGTAKTSRGQVAVVVKRASKGNVREQTIAVDPKRPEDAAGSLQPLFGASSSRGSADRGADAGVGGASAPEAPSPPWSTRRKVGLGLTAAGGVAVVIGIALWLNESSLQNQINGTPTPMTRAQIDSLIDLEDRAGRYALWGNVMVVAGVVIGGAGAYYLWRDHSSSGTTVAPAPVDHGAGAAIVVGGRW
jgi:hypothetical protein